ncbi:hypothetical protein SOPP22_01440 [Shewanella sp. OPT22]|nr:hypothetical protein SOPP22_01440 [Shewanella sp. OPT22]
MSIAAPADDTININQIFVQADGAVAVQSTINLASASSLRDCANGASWAKSWAGFPSDKSYDRMFAIMMSAQAQGKQISIRTDGCYGSWHKIISVYLKP